MEGIKGEYITILTEHQSTGAGAHAEYDLKPGFATVFNFKAFAVVATDEGFALILPTDLRKSIKNMVEGQDRIINIINGGPVMDNEVYDRLCKASLEYYPKGEVDPK